MFARLNSRDASHHTIRNQEITGEDQVTRLVSLSGFHWRTAQNGEAPHALHRCDRAIAQKFNEAISTCLRRARHAYRPEGWTVRQLPITPYSHANAFIRFKLALTEYEPTIKPRKTCVQAGCSQYARSLHADAQCASHPLGGPSSRHGLLTRANPATSGDRVMDLNRCSVSTLGILRTTRPT
jgi:hypothetical protein